MANIAKTFERIGQNPEHLRSDTNRRTRWFHCKYQESWCNKLWENSPKFLHVPSYPCPQYRRFSLDERKSRTNVFYAGSSSRDQETKELKHKSSPFGGRRETVDRKRIEWNVTTRFHGAATNEKRGGVFYSVGISSELWGLPGSRADTRWNMTCWEFDQRRREGAIKSVRGNRMQLASAKPWKKLSARCS